MLLKNFFQREYPIAKQLGWIHLFHSVEKVFNIKLHHNNNKITLKHHTLVRSLQGSSDLRFFCKLVTFHLFSLFQYLLFM